MFDKMFRNKKAQPDKIEMVLAQARRLLWLNDVNQARQLFVQVATKIQEEIKRSKVPDASYVLLQSQAQLGLWAVSYLEDSNQCSGLASLLGGQSLTPETAYFIAKVLQIKNDVSTDALKIYRNLLKLDPSPKIARQVRDIVIEISFSDIALALYITLVAILPDDITLACKLCRWYLLANDQNNARELAYHILCHDPSNRDANRCLGVIFERHKDWDLAIHHYRLSNDHLRLAVVLTKAERLDEAQKVLESVSNVEQTSFTWLYYRGWIAYQLGEISSTLKYWSFLQKANHRTNKMLKDSLHCINQHVLYKYLQNTDVPDQIIDELSSTGIDVSVLEAWKGAIELLCHHDLLQGKSLLQRAIRSQRNNIRIISYLALAEAQEKQDITFDRQLYQQLSAHYRDTTLFMWLRGLALLRDGDLSGILYLQKSYSDGICDRHLPMEAVQSVNWIVSQINGSMHRDISQGRVRDLDISQFHQLSSTTSPFTWAIASSYTMATFQQNEPIKWITVQPSLNTITTMWCKIQAAYYLHQKDWSSCLVQLDRRVRQLQWQIISIAIQEALRQQDWIALSGYVEQGLAIAHDHPQLKLLKQQLRPHMYQLLWQRSEFERLEHELEVAVRAGNASPKVYHGLALVYTRLAVMKDQGAASLDNQHLESAFTQEGHHGFLENHAHNNYWQLAIGYWATILSDDTYWHEWAQRRSVVYGETITDNQIHELTTCVLPQILRNYHEERILSDSPFSIHHRFYTAIIDHEIEATRAMRYVIRNITIHYSNSLPDVIRNFISPLLIKECGYSEQVRAFIKQLDDQRMSPYEVELIRSSFSPISDIKALVAIKAYDIALTALREHLVDPNYAAIRSDLTHELAHILELMTIQHINLENWDTALQFAREGQSLQSQNKDLQRLTVQAVVGLGNMYVQKGRFSDAIKALEEVRSNLQHIYEDLDILLSEAYIEWGYEAGRDGDYDQFICRLNKALSISPLNGRVNSGLNIAYYHRAIAKAQNNDFYSALEDAEKALEYQEDMETLTLIAELHRSIAISLDENSSFSQAGKHWEMSIDYALQRLNLEDTQENLRLFVDIAMSRILSLYSQESYTTAIGLAEKLINMVDDLSLYQINPYGLLSEMCTNYGAKLYNSGHRQQGFLITQKALAYNPDNQVARNNINIM